MLDFTRLLDPGETVVEVLADDVLLTRVAAGLGCNGDPLGTILAEWRFGLLSVPFPSWGEELGADEAINLL